MLPYAPLHHLLLGRRRRPARDDQRQRQRRADRVPRRRRAARGWAGIADAVAAARPPDPHPHRRLGRARRARAPDRAAPLARARPGRPRRSRSPCRAPVLACGAELKSTFCLARGARAWVGHHIGDLRNAETLTRLPRGHRALRAALRRRPGGRRARPAPRLPLDGLRARARGRGARRPCSTTTRTSRRAWPSTACTGPAVGAIYDGTGHGPDGTAWGGEILRRRPAVLPARRPPEPGPAARRRPRGARAVADGLRVARRRRRPATSERPGALRDAVAEDRWDAVARMARDRASRRRRRRAWAGCSTPSPRSAGVRAVTTYEGQAAIELEARRRRRRGLGAYALAPRPRRAGARPRRRSTTSARGRGARRVGALPPGCRARHRGRLRRRGGGRRARPRRPLGRRVPEPAAADADRGRARARSASGSSCPSACPPTTAGSPSARRRSPRRAADRPLRRGPAPQRRGARRTRTVAR